jgi:hypothetical protein
MKKILSFVFLFFVNFNLLFAAWNRPVVPNLGLPGDNRNIDGVYNNVIPNIIVQLIRYVAVIAVLSLMIAWIMYLISWWEEEKVKKAKSWILWSIIWVVISISAWGIINLINNITINN